MKRAKKSVERQLDLMKFLQLQKMLMLTMLELLNSAKLSKISKLSRKINIEDESDDDRRDEEAKLLSKITLEDDSIKPWVENVR